MFCPNCGRESLGEKKFCPSCGLKLQAIQEALLLEQSEQQASTPTSETPAPNPRNQLWILRTGFFIMMLGTLLAVFAKTSLGNNNLTDFGGFMVVLGIGMIGYFGISLIGAGFNRTTKSKLLPPSIQTKELPPTIEPHSIIEHTTRKLELKLEREEKRRPSQELFQP